MIAAGVYAPSVGQMPGESHLFLPEMARIARAEPMTALEKLFTLELPPGRSLSHLPGQFVEVSALGVGEAPISISSSPSRSNGAFELCVRRAGDVTGALHRMKPGDQVGIRGPFGRGFPIEKFRGKDMLFAPGGLGLAPLRSLINQVLDERALFGRVIILYGARTPSELLFKDELKQWGERDDLVRLGHAVAVFDSLPVAGGMMRVGIPPHRLPTELLDWEIQQIVDEGVELRLKRVKQTLQSRNR